MWKIYAPKWVYLKSFPDSESNEDSQADLTPSNSPAKRLMRDTDNAIFGGVCAGIAAYWGINPLWVKIIIYNFTIYNFWYSAF